MQNIISNFAFLISAVTMVLLLLTGVYFSVRLKLYQLRGLPFILKNTVATLLSREKKRSDGSITPFQAVTTALAGTMGVGNIAGVATALVAGGPGAIFWMWVGAFFGMMTKYAEIYLSVKYRRIDQAGKLCGGPMYYMADGVKSSGLAAVFAVLCAASSLGIGNMTQVNSVSTAMEASLRIPPLVTGLLVATIVALVVLGGVKRIASVTEMVIPFISILYIFFAGAFLWIHRASIHGAFQMILSGAFSLRPAVGGVAGYGVSQAARYGLSRGVFTNEAGLGSAPIAHASADCKSPGHQGVWGIFEVFLDTIVVCTITALVILLAGNGAIWQSGMDGAPLTSAAFASSFGKFGGIFLSISIAFYAISAMLGWCFYGESALGFLVNNSKPVLFLYRVVFLACIVIGAIGNLGLIWGISDLLNVCMAIPNLYAIFSLRNQVRAPQ